MPAKPNLIAEQDSHRAVCGSFGTFSKLEEGFPAPPVIHDVNSFPPSSCIGAPILLIFIIRRAK